MQRRITLTLAAGALVAGTASAQDATAWDRAYDPAAHARFIPVELWTGAPWDGEHVLRMGRANLVFGDGRKAITGPTDYTIPGTGRSVPVYQRVNRDKRQLFTLVSRDDGLQGLGRVFDNRYDRQCADEIKMPLGLWHENERRSFDVHCGALVRHYAINILTLDGPCASGRAHCLVFHWLVDGGAQPGTDMRYTYAPGVGLVSETGNE